MAKFTIDLEEEDIIFVQKVLTSFVSERTEIIRSDAFEHYGPNESAMYHKDVQQGCQVLGKLPSILRRKV